MAKKQTIQLFEEKKVRTVWDDEKEKWFFCVVDVVEALTDSKNPTDYIKKMKKRDPELSKGWGQIVTPLSVQTAGGKQQKTRVGSDDPLFHPLCLDAQTQESLSSLVAILLNFLDKKLV